MEGIHQIPEAGETIADTMQGILPRPNIEPDEQVHVPSVDTAIRFGQSIIRDLLNRNFQHPSANSPVFRELFGHDRFPLPPGFRSWEEFVDF